MNVEDIQKFLDTKMPQNNPYVRINFKKRNSIYGIFVRDHSDYASLRSKNFWRIVPRQQFVEWNKSKNVNLAKIFNGSEFTRLVSSAESLEKMVAGGV
jgi:hypothetical protein